MLLHPPPSLLSCHHSGLRGHIRPQLLVENPLCIHAYQYFIKGRIVKNSKAVLELELFLYLVAAVLMPRKHYMIVSYSTVGKWALLAAGKKDINRERQVLRFVSFMCSYHFRSFFERDTPDFMCLLLFFT